MPPSFFDKAVNFVSYRPRSAHETAIRLKHLGATPEQIKEVIAKLIHYDYLNDKNFATWLSASRLKQGRSPLLIKLELKRHHLDPDLISSSLKEVSDPASQLSQARLALSKKFPSLPSIIDLKLRQKLFSFLLRRGFGYETTASVIDELAKRG